MNIKFIGFPCIALILSILLSGELILLGVDKFVSIQTNTGGNYPVFPNFFSQVIFGLLYVAINIFYLLSILHCLANKPVMPFPKIIKKYYVFLAIAFIAYPLGNDTYLYLQYGLMGLNHVNPFINPASSFNSILLPYLRWGQSSTYGIISLLFFMISALFTHIHIILGIYILKLFFLLLHILNTYLIWRLLENSKQQTIITIAYLLNPLILLEQITSAHVDILVCTALSCLIICIKNRLYLAGIFMIIIGFCAKTLPVIWMPILLVRFFRLRQWRTLALVGFIYILLIFLLTETALPTIAAWKSLLNPGATGTSASLHKIVSIVLDYLPDLTKQTKEFILNKFKIITYAFFVLFYIYTLIKVFLSAKYNVRKLSLDIGMITLFLFLVSTAWNMPWYVSTILPIAALLNFKQPRFLLTTMSFYLSSSCYYLFLGEELLQSIIMIGLPIFLFLMQPKLMMNSSDISVYL